MHVDILTYRAKINVQMNNLMKIHKKTKMEKEFIDIEEKF